MEGRPVYNDVQCGNGPPSVDINEFHCPGRVDIGPEGCGHVGPKWNFLNNNTNINNVTPPSGSHPDILAVVNVTRGNRTPRPGWKDSYSVGNHCYCASTLDHDIGNYFVETPIGWKTISEICTLLGSGPGMNNSLLQYNDIQCGNGPPNSAGDEHDCPGRTDMGLDGCGQIGPKWNFEELEAPTTSVPTTLSPVTVAPTTTEPTTTTSSSGSTTTSPSTVAPSLQAPSAGPSNSMLPTLPSTDDATAVSFPPSPVSSGGQKLGGSTTMECWMSLLVIAFLLSFTLVNM